jgi:hypothetical protein
MVGMRDELRGLAAAVEQGVIGAKRLGDITDAVIDRYAAAW